MLEFLFAIYFIINFISTIKGALEADDPFRPKKLTLRLGCFLFPGFFFGYYFIKLISVEIK